MNDCQHRWKLPAVTFRAGVMTEVWTCIEGGCELARTRVEGQIVERSLVTPFGRRVEK